MTYTLITANRNYSSWSLRPWLLMTELGIAFNDRLEPFATLDNRSAFEAFSPTGQVPCLIDGDITIWDSLGITLYLAERHRDVWPEDVAARAWAQCATAEMHSGFPSLRSRCPMNIGVRVRLPTIDAPLRRDVERIAALWREGIERFGGPFLAGARFGAVDAFYAPVVFRARSYGLEVGEAGRAWADTLCRLAGMQVWEAAALAETWREAGHEAELVASGTVMEDRRRA